MQDSQRGERLARTDCVCAGRDHSDRIYSDWILEMLHDLGKRADLSQSCSSWEGVCELFPDGLSMDACKRARKLRRDGTGFPETVWLGKRRLEFNVYKNVYSALMDLAMVYRGPLKIYTYSQEFLSEKGVRIADLEGLGDPFDYRWQRKGSELRAFFRRLRDVDDTDVLEDCLPDELAYRRMCDVIACRCEKAASPEALAPSSPAARGAEKGCAAAGGAEPGPSALGLLVPLLSGEFAGEPLLSFLAEDGAGAVDQGLPDTTEALLAAALDPRLATRVEEASGAGADAVAAAALGWFSVDATHRFAGLIGRCRTLLTPLCDERLLRCRMRLLFERLAKASPRSERVDGVLSQALRFSGGDCARLLACLILALLIGPDRSEQFNHIVFGGGHA